MRASGLHAHLDLCGATGHLADYIIQDDEHVGKQLNDQFHQSWSEHPKKYDQKYEVEEGI